MPRRSAVLRVKRPGYFKNPRDEGRLTRFLRYGWAEDPHLPGNNILIGPGAITDWTVERVNDDEYVIRITSFPDLGDRDERGDGLGLLIRTEWSVNGGEWLDLGIVSPGEVRVTAVNALTISIRAVASAGVSPVSTLVVSVVAPDRPNLLLIAGNDDDDLVTEDGGQILLYLGDPPIEVPSAPVAFAPNQWSFTDAGTSGTISLAILSVPVGTSEIQYSLDGGANVLSLSGSGLGERLLTGLSNGVAVSAIIRAGNTLGYSPWSGIKTATPTGVPAAFSDVGWTLTDAGTGGSLILNVLVLPFSPLPLTDLEYTDGVSTVSLSGGVTGSRLITGLTDDEEAFIQVRARNALGPGGWSDTKSATPTAPETPLVKPSAFTAGQWTLTDAGTGGALTLNITALPAAGDLPISALYYRIGAASLLSGIGTGVRTLTGLTDGVSVNVQIAAESPAGLGDWSDTKSATPTGVTEDPPDAFTAGQWTLADAASGGTLTLNITALPASDASISALYYRVNGGASALLTGVGTGVRSITGLSNGVSASIEIRAESSAGLGGWSDVKSATPSAPGLGIGAMTIGSTFIVG